MFMRFFSELKAAKVPVTLKEYLMLMEGMDRSVIDRKVEDFYYLSRATLVKDEKYLDRFDVVFGHVFKGLDLLQVEQMKDIPTEWLKRLTDSFLTDEERKQIEEMGGFDKMMEMLQERMKQAQEEGDGDGDEGDENRRGNGRNFPIGANGYHPEGIRIGQDKGRHSKAIKVWDKREYKNLDDQVELGTRNIKVALRRLRKFARTGQPDELDMKGNIKVCEELFSAAKTEFKTMEFYYFHNCLYETVWKDNRRRHAEKLDMWDILNTYGKDYKIIFVGDATMSPYEITYPGGSVEHWNEEPGAVWMDRVAQHWNSIAWLNPTPQRHWDHTPSIGVMRQLLGERMFPLTLEGLESAMRELVRGGGTTSIRPMLS